VSEQRFAIGMKVRVVGFEDHGIGEVASYPDANGMIAVDFYRSPVQFKRIKATSVRRDRVPEQTRCFVPLNTGFRIGRMLGAVEGPAGAPLTYHVAFPNEERARRLEETEFHVRSILGDADPVETLAALAHETPFFFENRLAFVSTFDRAASASRGLHSLDSASVELFPHQADAVRRVLQDPNIRYLFADEVGLGKTIEAGAILRQFEADDPGCRSLVLVPPVLTGQWESELRHRFHLMRARVATHSEIDSVGDEPLQALVIDEAHRLIEAVGGQRERFEKVRRLCARTPHLLLLSATPILHRDAEVLSLLHLLDPDQYKMDDVDGFRRRLARRIPIGRLLLGLERASSPLLIRRQLELLSKELSDDEDLQCLLASAPQGIATENTAEWRGLATRARVLVSETWRLHRRLIRTRRSALIEEGEIRRLRQVEPPESIGNYTDDAGAFRALWEAIDELRSSAAARSAQLSDGEARHLRDSYLLLVQAAPSAGSHCLIDLLREMQADPAWAFASELITAIDGVADRVARSARLEALEAILADRPEDEPRWVVFCRDGADADQTATFLARAFPASRVLTLTASNVPNAARALTDFANSPGRSLLVVDSSAEEGLNLQAADGLILLDLPFQPLRLEQRIGRLDRLDRTRPLRALAVLSTDDSDDARQAFDRAWFEVLVNGLGLFEDSIADLPYLLERQLEEISRLAFERGSAALYDHVHTLKAVLADERRDAAEQAVIDGTSVAGVRNAAWWKALEEADADDDQLSRSFHAYVTQTLKLRMESADPQHIPAKNRRFLMRRDRSHDVLLPTDRLVSLANLIAHPFTFSRKRAAHDDEVHLLRPGCRLLDWMRELADWDDRGRAFALWRRVPSSSDPQVVVRVCVTATLDDAAAANLKGLDAVGKASIGRLAANWFALWRSEWFIQADGSPADDAHVEQCRPAYDKRTDENLSGSRATELVKVLGVVDFPARCRAWANEAVTQAQKSAEFCRRKEEAQSAANGWFAQREARLRLRGRHDVSGDITAEATMLGTLHDHVGVVLLQPKFRVDAMGVYVLAAEGCPR
jgi:ATP-dependent helicase HepA